MVSYDGREDLMGRIRLKYEPFSRLVSGGRGVEDGAVFKIRDEIIFTCGFCGGLYTPVSLDRANVFMPRLRISFIRL